MTDDANSACMEWAGGIKGDKKCNIASHCIKTTFSELHRCCYSLSRSRNPVKQCPILVAAPMHLESLGIPILTPFLGGTASSAGLRAVKVVLPSVLVVCGEVFLHSLR